MKACRRNAPGRVTRAFLGRPRNIPACSIAGGWIGPVPGKRYQQFDWGICVPGDPFRILRRQMFISSKPYGVIARPLALFVKLCPTITPVLRHGGVLPVPFRHGFDPGCLKCTDCYNLGQSVLSYLSMAWQRGECMRIAVGCIGPHHKGNCRNRSVGDSAGCRGNKLVDQIGRHSRKRERV